MVWQPSAMLTSTMRWQVRANLVTGRAYFIDNPELRALAVRLASYTPADRYILFEFDTESAASTVYQ